MGMELRVPPLPAISPRAAAGIVAILRRQAGIAIAPEKSDLLRNRLVRRLRALGMADFDDYLVHLGGAAGGDELPRMVEALTTHTTAFSRGASTAGSAPRACPRSSAGGAAASSWSGALPARPAPRSGARRW